MSVQTPDGPQPISALHAGDPVLAYNEATHTTGVYTVTATMAHPDPVVVRLTLDDDALTTTPEHPFRVLLRGWVEAAALRPGMAVQRADGCFDSRRPIFLNTPMISGTRYAYRTPTLFSKAYRLTVLLFRSTIEQ